MAITLYGIKNCEQFRVEGPKKRGRSLSVLHAVYLKNNQPDC